MAVEEFILQRACPATLIPAGTAATLPSGAKVWLKQALGGTVTVGYQSALYSIAAEELDALGATAAARFRAAAAASATVACSGDYSEEAVWAALKTCFDPEIPVNIVDLGLIYDLRAEPRNDGRQNVVVQMTLTAPGCGMGPAIARDAQRKIVACPGVAEATVNIVWDPQWTPHMISPAGRAQLGL